MEKLDYLLMIIDGEKGHNHAVTKLSLHYWKEYHKSKMDILVAGNLFILSEGKISLILEQSFMKITIIVKLWWLMKKQKC